MNSPDIHVLTGLTGWGYVEDNKVWVDVPRFYGVKTIEFDSQELRCLAREFLSLAEYLEAEAKCS